MRVHGFSPGDRIATLIMSLCTSIPATRSYSTFIRAATSCSGNPPADGNKHAARQSPGERLGVAVPVGCVVADAVDQGD